MVLHQVATVQQARQAAERGVDIIIAQGSEAGGFGGTVAGLALIPQVVDAVRPIPVIAAGGIADGRGLAAALVLGAQGINMGTRFLPSQEAPISEGWKQGGGLERPDELSSAPGKAGWSLGGSAACAPPPLPRGLAPAARRRDAGRRGLTA
jgi:hypothetical protein